jgi:hypothetical protein
VSSSEPSSPLAELTWQVGTFARDRDWERFHTPKSLAMALTGEATPPIPLFTVRRGC